MKTDVKTGFLSIWKNLNPIILCVLIVSGFFLLSLIFEQKVSSANETTESAIVSLKAHGKLKEAMELIDEYINSCSTNETYSWGYNEKGGIFTLMGEYTKAIYAYQESLKYSEGASDDFITLKNIGSLQHSLGDYTDAMSYYDEAIARMDDNDPRKYWLTMHVAWSGFYLSRGDTMVLKLVYEETKPILQKIENHLNQFNKGKAYDLASRFACQLGKYDDAIELSREYAKIKNTDFAKLSFAVNLLYLKKEAEANKVFSKVDLREADKVLIAQWYWLKGDEELARSSLEEYPDSVEKEKAWRHIRNDEILPYDVWKEARRQKWFVELIGPLTTDYPNVATYRNNLGAAWNARGNYDKAIEYYEKALKSGLKAYGEDHPDIATYRNNLGAAWKAKGEYVKAIEYYEKALKSDLKTFGENHPKIAAYRNNLGVAWNAKGEYGKAIEYLEKALKSELKSFGENHPNVATYGNNLGAALHANGEYDKAIEYLEKALSVIQVRLGNDHPYTKTLKDNISLAKEEKPE